MNDSLPVILDTEAATAWTAYQTLVARLMATHQLTRDMGERLCSALGQARWHRGYQLERARLG